MSQPNRALSILFLGLAGLWLPACGGGRSPSAPSVPVGPPATPAPVPLPVAHDGSTHEVVFAQITPATPRLGEAVSATAPSYLMREQAFDGTALFLWPAEQEYVNQLVYHLQFTDDSYRMVRWASGFTVTLDGDLAQNDTVLRKTQEVVAEVVRRTGLPVSVGPGGACRILIDPTILDDDAIGQASWTFRGATIVSAEVKFARVQEISGGVNADYANTLLHEMGHVMGLGHSPSTRDVMTPGSGPGTRVGEFQPSEAVTLHMMYGHRVAGNLPPDRDPALSGRSSAAPRTVVIRN